MSDCRETDGTERQRVNRLLGCQPQGRPTRIQCHILVVSLASECGRNEKRGWSIFQLHNTHFCCRNSCVFGSVPWQFWRLLHNCRYHYHCQFSSFALLLRSIDNVILDTLLNNRRNSRTCRRPSPVHEFGEKISSYRRSFTRWWLVRGGHSVSRPQKSLAVIVASFSVQT